jgi:hypothetical protein
MTFLNNGLGCNQQQIRSKLAVTLHTASIALEKHGDVHLIEYMKEKYK